MSPTATIIEVIVRNLAILISLTYVQSLVHRRIAQSPLRLQSIALGILFGGTASAIILLTPPLIGELRTDGRAILIALAGVFGGWPAAIISFAITSITRWSIGGPGWSLGLIEMASGVVLGSILHRQRYLRGDSPPIFVFAILATASALVNGTFAFALFGDNIESEDWPLLGLLLGYFVVASFALGFLVTRERERVRLERDTVRTANQLEHVLASVQAGVSILDRSGRVVEMNDVGAEIIGVQRSDIVGSRVGTSDWEYYDEDEQPLPPDKRPGAVILESREPLDDMVIAFRIRPDDPLRWLMVNGLPVDDGAIITFYDITQLREQRDFVESITSSSPDIIYIFDLVKQSNIYSNYNMLETLGYSSEEIEEMGDEFLPSLLHPEDVERLPELLERWNHVEGNELLTVQYRMRHKDGTWHWFEARDRVFRRDSKGVATQIVGAARDITERLEAEQALAESERRLQAIMDNAKNSIFLKDSEGRYILANKQFLAYADLQEEEVIGKTDIEIGGPELAKPLIKNDQVVFETGQPLEEQWQAPEALGGEKFLTYKFPLKNDEGEVYAVGGIATDITPLARAEDALAASESRLRLAMKATEDGVWDWDATSGEVFVSPRWYEVMGGNGIEPRFDMIRERTHPDDWEASFAAIRARLKGDDTPFEIECRVKAQTGEWRWLAVRGGVVQRSKDGRVVRMIGTIRDISMRMAAEQSLHRLSQAVEQSLDGVIVADPNGVIRYSNQSAVSLFGRSSENLEGQLLDDLHPADHGEAPWRIVTQSGTNSDIACTCIRGNNTEFPARMSVSLLKTDDDELQGIILIVHDRTSEQELEDQLRQAQKMEAVGRLAGGIAHDFNNILQAIQGYTEFALSEIDEGHPVEDPLKESARATERATTLVSQLLTFSRRQTLRPEPVDLNALIGDAINLIRRLLGDAVDVRIDLRPSLPNIFADSGQLEQILINLCVNARDALDNGGSITLATGERTFDANDCANYPWARPGEFVSLMVEDTGAGIPPEVQSRVFEPFFTTKATGEGTGLGLASVYATVARHEGFIHLESEPGEGSRFTIYIPVAVAQSADRSSDHTNRKSTLIAGAGDILIAEDNDQVRFLAERVLQRAGYTTHAACDGEEAINLVKTLGPTISLALLDVVMPRKNGRAVYDYIRENGYDFPVLFSSGYSYDVLDEGQIPEGDFELLQKPYAVAELVQRVHHALKKQQSSHNR